jgi:hypothetical protein
LLLQDILGEYLYHIQVQNYSHRTAKGYKNNNLAYFRYIKEDFNIEELEKVRAQHINMELNQLYLKCAREKLSRTGSTGYSGKNQLDRLEKYERNVYALEKALDVLKDDLISTF